jgi:hypothetical protein
MQQDHFKYIFWYIVGTTTIVLTYIFIITFITIPKENIRFADTAQGFLLGSVLGAGLAYLVGGNPTTNSKKVSVLPENSDTLIQTQTTAETTAPAPANTSGVIVEGFKKQL